MSSKGRCVVLADLTDSVDGRGRRCRSACNLPRPDRSGNTTSHPTGGLTVRPGAGCDATASRGAIGRAPSPNASPPPPPVTEAFLREAYLDIGLATTHIEQLTGQPMERILSLTRTHAIPVRPPRFSPMVVRQRQQTRTQNPVQRAQGKRSFGVGDIVLRSQKYSTGEPTATITCDWPE